MSVEITVALITAAAGFLALVLTKEQKISDFRQAWINAFREDIAALMAKMTAYDLAQQKNAVIRDENQKKVFNNPNSCKNDFELNIDNIELYKVEIQLITERLKLRLNPSNDRVFISKLNEVPNALYNLPADAIKRQNLTKLIDELGEQAHVTLKKEWEVVKKGESWYKSTKWIVLILLVVCFVFIFVDKVIF